MKIFRNKFFILLFIFAMLLNVVSPINLMADQSGTTTYSNQDGEAMYNTGPITVGGRVSNSDEFSNAVTYTSANDTMTYQITISKQVSVGDTVEIVIPLGVDLVSAPGVTEISGGNIVDKPFIAATEAMYFNAAPTWVNGESVSSVSTNSGTLTYELKTISSFSFIIETKINSDYVPFSIDEEKFELGELTATLKSGDTTESSSTDISVLSQAADIQFEAGTTKLSEYNTSSSSAYSQKLTSTFIAADRTYDIASSVKLLMNPAIADGTSNYKVSKITFNVECPVDTVITARTASQLNIELIEEGDTWIYQLSTTSSWTASGSAFTFGDFFILNFENVANNDVPGTEYNVTLSNVTFAVSSFDYESKTFNTIHLNEIDATSTGTVYVSPEVDNSKYAVNYTNTTPDTELLNPYTGAVQTLYSTRRTLSTYTDEASEISGLPTGTTESILMEFVSYPNGTTGYLDDVSKIIMRIPFLGEEGMERYASQIESVTVWYESDDLGTLGITTEVGQQLDISAFKEAMLSGKLTTSNSLSLYNVDPDGIVQYAYTGTASPYLSIVAPEGKSIVKVSVEITGDNAFHLTTTSWENYTSLVYGSPKLDEYTGEYSSYQFSTYVKNEGDTWDLKASSSKAGFRWKQPAPFELSAKNTSLTAGTDDYYYFNIAKYNTYFHLSNYQNNQTPGYQNLGSIDISNMSGTPLGTGQYLVSEFIADTTSTDVVKKIVLPWDPTTKEDSIYVIAYEYANGSTHMYTAGVTADKPYVIEDGQAVIYATGDNSITKLEIALTAWGTETTAVEFGIYGYIEDTSDLLREDKHTVSYQVYDDMGEKVEGLTATETINSKFIVISKTGADVRINDLSSGVAYGDASYDAITLMAGRSSDVTFELFGGSVNNVSNGYWKDITFNIVLPTGITLDQVNGISFSYERNGADLLEPTSDEVIGNIAITEATLSQAEAQAYFEDNSVTGATVYTCTLDDAEALLYGIRVHTEAESFAKMKISATITPSAKQSSTLIPWSKVLLLGSNHNYETFEKIKNSKLAVIEPGDGINETKGEVLTNAELAEYAEALQVGVTTNIITGSSNQYLHIDNKPFMMVHNLNVQLDNKYYFYSELLEDSVAVFHRGDTGTVNYSITNTISDEDANKNDSYVFLGLPTATSTTGSLTNQSDFQVDISAIKVNGDKVYNATNLNPFNLLSLIADVHEITSTSTVDVKYMSSADLSKSVTSVDEYYDDYATDTFTQSSHDVMVLKVSDQEAFSTFEVNVDFTAPTHVTTETEYIELSGKANYYFVGSSMAEFESEDINSIIRFAYENPEWLVEVEGITTSSSGYITGSIETGIEDLKVLHKNELYTTETLGSACVVAPSLEGYTFKGWYTNKDLTSEYVSGSEITANTVLYAKYVVNQLEVTYEYNNGDDPFVKTVDWSGAVVSPTSPTKAGYTFTGWYIDEACKTLVSADTYGEIAGSASAITIYAGYYENPTYSVIYNVDGDKATIVDTEKYEAKEVVEITSEIPEKTGYNFAGWLYDGSIYQAKSILAMGSGDIELVAQWARKTYTITYLDDDEVGTKLMNDSSVKYQATISISEPPEKEGYTFDYWRDQNGAIVRSATDLVMPANDIVLTANWLVNEYTLTFQGVREGELEGFDFNELTDNYYVELDYNKSIPMPKPVREGYIFEGWTLLEDKSEVGDTLTMPASHVTVVANWKVTTWDVSYNTDGGNLIDSLEDKDYGSAITLPTPIKEGHTFLYWVDQDGKEYDAGDSYTIPAKDSTFEAVWNLEKYTVSFVDIDDHTNVYHKEEVAFNGTITLPTPVKEGHKFNGWTFLEKEYTDADFTMDKESYADEEDNVTFYANWSINEYNITFRVDGEVNIKGFETITDYYDEAITLYSAPTLEGHTFKCWSDGVNEYDAGSKINMPEGGLELHAVWEVNTRTVSFTNAGDSSFADRKLKYGESTVLPTPTKTGYTFTGWTYDDKTYDGHYKFEMIDTDVVFVATWEVHKHDVVFDYGYDNESDTRTDVAYGEIISFDVLQRDGYIFGGWAYDGKIYTSRDEYSMPDEEVIFTAVWTVKEYTLTFENVPDDMLTSTTVNFNQVYQLPKPTKEGHTLAGWLDGETFYPADGTITMPANNVTLVAKWDANEYDVTFNYGYDDVTDVQQYLYNDVVTFETLEREGYTFKGWSIDGVVYFEGDEYVLGANPVVFEALWTINEYTITFEECGDSQLEDLVLNYNQTTILPTPTKDGFTFAGWLDGDVLYAVDGEFTMGAQNTTLVAKWVEIVEEDENQDQDTDTDVDTNTDVDTDTDVDIDTNVGTSDNLTVLPYIFVVVVSMLAIIFLTIKKKAIKEEAK